MKQQREPLKLFIARELIYRGPVKRFHQDDGSEEAFLAGRQVQLIGIVKGHPVKLQVVGNEGATAENKATEKQRKGSQAHWRFDSLPKTDWEGDQ